MKISKPLLSKSSNNRLKDLIDRHPHCTLVSGDTVGNHNQVATWLGASLSSESPIEYGLDGLTIEEVRTIYAVVRHKSVGGHRVIIIYDLDKARAEAQNGLLKLLEEPVEGVSYVLSSASLSKILNTIQSRSSVIKLQLPTFIEYAEHFSDSDSQELKAAYAATGGYLPELETYLSGQSEVTQLAKQAISGTVYDRLKVVTVVQSDREQAIKLLRAMQNIYTFLLHKSPEKVATFGVNAGQCSDTIELLKRNSHIKLSLDGLFVNL